MAAAFCGALALLLCLLVDVSGKPASLLTTLTLPGFTRARQRFDVVKKEYSGRRVKNDSILMVYLHDQTIAVVEVGPQKLLLSCELIEISGPEEAEHYLKRQNILLKPLPIFFVDMMKLMSQCQELDASKDRTNTTAEQNRTLLGGFGTFNPLSILRGIIPGTRWCGTGDVAENYYDLGEEPAVDRCCRTHDLCPVKIGPYTRKYNLTNDALYTKSHCLCDDLLYSCLHHTDSNTARIMGHIYFNVIQVPCIADTKAGRRFKPSKTNF